MKVLVGIPTFNEANTIEKTLQRVKEYSQYVNVVVCDGGSTDGTIDIVKNTGTRLIHAPSYGDAIRSAFEAMTNEDHVVIMDSESHDAMEMFREMERVHAHRIIRYLAFAGCRKHSHAKFIRKFITTISRMYVHTLFRVTVKDVTSGFRAYPKAFVKEMIHPMIGNPTVFKVPNYVVNVALAIELQERRFGVHNFKMTYTGGHSALTMKKFGQALRWGFHLMLSKGKL